MGELKILSKLFNEKRENFFYKRNIITEMKIKSICEHYNIEGNRPLPLKSVSGCRLEMNRKLIDNL